MSSMRISSSCPPPDWTSTRSSPATPPFCRGSGIGTGAAPISRASAPAPPFWRRRVCSTGVGRRPIGPSPKRWRAAIREVDWRPDMFITEDERLLCSGGVYSAIDLSIYLVEKFCGHEIAVNCAKSLLVHMPRSHQSGYAVLPLSRPHSDERIRAVEAFIDANYAQNLSSETLAARRAYEPAQLHPPLQGRDGALAGQLPADAADYRRETHAGRRRSQRSIHQPGGRLRGPRFLPLALPPIYRHDAGRIPQPVRPRRPRRPLPTRQAAHAGRGAA